MKEDIEIFLFIKSVTETGSAEWVNELIHYVLFLEADWVFLKNGEMTLHGDTILSGGWTRVSAHAVVDEYFTCVAK